jgi:glutaredoxin-like protein
MALLDEETKEKVRRRLADTLVGPVEVRLYRRPDLGPPTLPSGRGYATCDASEELGRALAEAAPDKLRLTVIDVSEESVDDQAVPRLTVGRPGAESRITFQGLPGGYEFATLLDALERAAGGGDQLPAKLGERLAGLERGIELMVFVTPTCPYCPRAASLANRMALTSAKVRSLVVEANEYPELSAAFEVQGVPRTVVNRAGAFVGALPEATFVDSVMKLAEAA